MRMYNSLFACALILASRVSGEDDDNEFESLCGHSHDWKSISCLDKRADNSKHKELKKSLARSVVQFFCSGCTGFKVGPNMYITNAHCVPECGDAEADTIAFDYTCENCIKNARTCTNSDTAGFCDVKKYQTGGETWEVDFDKDQDDWTLWKIDGDCAYNDDVPILRFSYTDAQVGDEIFLIGHPLGYPQTLADREKIDGEFRPCKVVPNDENWVGIKYLCDTAGGSSGSPVFNNQGKVVGLHSSGGCHLLDEENPGNRGLTTSRLLELDYFMKCPEGFRLRPKTDFNGVDIGECGIFGNSQTNVATACVNNVNCVGFTMNRNNNNKPECLKSSVEDPNKNVNVDFCQKIKHIVITPQPSLPPTLNPTLNPTLYPTEAPTLPADIQECIDNLDYDAENWILQYQECFGSFGSGSGSGSGFGSSSGSGFGSGSGSGIIDWRDDDGNFVDCVGQVLTDEDCKWEEGGYDVCEDWVADGSCDDGMVLSDNWTQMYLNCAKFGNDGGDCEGDDDGICLAVMEKEECDALEEGEIIDCWGQVLTDKDCKLEFDDEEGNKHTYDKCSQYLGDGDCDGGQLPYRHFNFNCEAFDFDGGDCKESMRRPKPTPSPQPAPTPKPDPTTRFDLHYDGVNGCPAGYNRVLSRNACLAAFNEDYLEEIDTLGYGLFSTEQFMIDADPTGCFTHKEKMYFNANIFSDPARNKRKIVCERAGETDWHPKDNNSKWCGKATNENDYNQYDSVGFNWHLDTSYTGGWRWCEISVEQCKYMCTSLGDCAEVWYTEDGCCFPSKRVCSGSYCPGGCWADKSGKHVIVGAEDEFCPSGYYRQYKDTAIDDPPMDCWYHSETAIAEACNDQWFCDGFSIQEIGGGALKIYMCTHRVAENRQTSVDWSYCKKIQDHSNDFHWVTQGDHTKNCKDSNKCASSLVKWDEKYKVRCCSDSNISGWMKTGDKLWASSDVDNCEYMDWATAQIYCKSEGARLCTQHEIDSGITGTTKCEANKYPIWTGSGVNNFNWVVKGSSAGSCNFLVGDCRSRVAHPEDLYPVRCCRSTAKTGWKQTCNSVWMLQNQCETLNLKDADEFCESKGGRLCNKSEVENDCAKDTSCEYNEWVIWTGTAGAGFELAKKRGDRVYLTYDECKERCLDNIVVPQTNAETEYVRKMLPAKTRAWVGLEFKNSKWHRGDNEYTGLPNWDSGKGNGGSKTRAVMSWEQGSNSGKWHDLAVTSDTNYWCVCNMAAEPFGAFTTGRRRFEIDA